MTAAKTDWEIASAATLRPIAELAFARLGIPADSVEPYGLTKAKIGMGFIRQALATRLNGKLIVVTAINPTPASEGKTTTMPGLPRVPPAVGVSVSAEGRISGLS